MEPPPNGEALHHTRVNEDNASLNGDTALLGLGAPAITTGVHPPSLTGARSHQATIHTKVPRKGAAPRPAIAKPTAVKKPSSHGRKKKTQGNFSMKGTRVHANVINQELVIQLMTAWTGIHEDLKALFPEAAVAQIAEGLQVAAVLLFAAASHLSKICNTGNSLHINCDQYALVSKLKQDVKGAARSMHSRIIKMLTAPFRAGSHPGMDKFRKSVDILLSNAVNTPLARSNTAPYLRVAAAVLPSSSRLESAVLQIAQGGRLRYRGKDDQVASLKQSLHNFFQDVRTLAKRAKGALPRTEMLHSSHEDDHGKDLRSLVCGESDGVPPDGTGEALRNAAAKLKRSTRGYFFVYATAVLSQIVAMTETLLGPCRKLSACDSDLHCYATKATSGRKA